MNGDTLDTATALVGLTVGAVVAIAVAGTIGLFYLGRTITWMVRR